MHISHTFSPEDRAKCFYWNTVVTLLFRSCQMWEARQKHPLAYWYWGTSIPYSLKDTGNRCQLKKSCHDVTYCETQTTMLCLLIMRSSHSRGCCVSTKAWFSSIWSDVMTMGLHPYCYLLDMALASLTRLSYWGPWFSRETRCTYIRAMWCVAPCQGIVLKIIVNNDDTRLVLVGTVRAELEVMYCPWVPQEKHWGIINASSHSMKNIN